MLVGLPGCSLVFIYVYVCPLKPHKAKLGKVISLYSAPFYTSRHGYKMCLRLYMDGDWGGKGSHLSFFLTLMKGEYDALLPWPFRQTVSPQLATGSGPAERHSPIISTMQTPFLHHSNVLIMRWTWRLAVLYLPPPCQCWTTHHMWRMIRSSWNARSISVDWRLPIWWMSNSQWIYFYMFKRKT